jgi:8-oxo-dGTP pyrophosphatase MutT (NUDIX family)
MEKHFVGQVAQKALLKYKDFFVLVKEEGSDVWILPGGRLNVDETSEQGILREIQEELGIESAIEKIIDVDVYHGGAISKNPKFFVFYLVSALPNQEIIINNEIAEFVLISKKEELEKYPMHENQKSVLKRFLK